MSATEHTPGPWEVELILGLPRVISDSRKSTCRVVADMHIQEGIGAVSHGKNPALVAEISANARLIAAAPDLLFLAKWMIDHPGECVGDHGSIERQANEIVAKAEGRS